MPIDPLVTLAISLQSNKGVYALLLGSGISSAAGIPTGWDVVLDLIQKLAKSSGEDVSGEPEKWFKARFRKSPDYAELLEDLTQTKAERTQLLRGYFEPTEDERAEGLKTPTKAHRAIAELMRLGYVRVIITTNFDRLLENALKDAGMEPVVISTPDAIEGAPPLPHAQCTIIKLHGDYLDHRLRNISEELASYEKPIDCLLDRVFDEFGLIVCGWSATYDKALRAAIERCPNRRYPTYWAVRGKPSEAAERLIKLRAATTITIADADELFGRLNDSIVALERFQLSDPISVKVAVARAKRYLSSPEYQIDFHDLMFRETERVVEAVYGPAFPVQHVQFSAPELASRMAAFEEASSVLLSLAAAAGYWSKPEHHPVIIQCVRRLLEYSEIPNGQTIFVDLRRYPALLFLYSVGLAAIAADNYDLLVKIFKERVKVERRENVGPLAAVFHQQKVIDQRHQMQIVGRENEFTPLSNHIQQQLRPYLHEYLPGDAAWEHTFDWFEYVVGLFHCYETVDWPAVEKSISEGADPIGRFWGPIGCFGRRHRWSSEWLLREMEIQNGVLPPRLAKLLQALLGGNDSARQRFLLAKKLFDAFVVRATELWC